MAKMTQQQIKDVAQKVAYSQRDTFTLAELQTMDWQGRRAEADRLGLIARDTATASGTRIDNTSLFLSAFSDQLQGLWASRLKEQEQARRTWQRAIEGTTLEDAVAKIHARVLGMWLRGADIQFGSDRVTVKIQHSFGVDGTVYLSFERDSWEGSVKNPDAEADKAGTYHLKVEYSWGGMNRTPAEAAASVRVYQTLLALGDEVSAVMQRETVWWVWTSKKTEAAEAMAAVEGGE